MDQGNHTVDIDDWENDFVTQVYFVAKDELCEKDDQPLFTSDWYGIKGVYYIPNMFGTVDRYIYYSQGTGEDKKS